MAIFVMPILKPLSSVTTTVVTTTTTTTLSTTISGVSGAPPTRILGYFTGCPSPALPPMPISAQAISNVIQRCNVRPPWVRVPPRWSVMPGPNSLFAPRAF